MRVLNVTMVSLNSLIFMSLLSDVLAYASNRDAIPNGYSVGAAGHNGNVGGASRNNFGLDFKDVGYQWTPLDKK